MPGPKGPASSSHSLFNRLIHVRGEPAHHVACRKQNRGRTVMPNIKIDYSNYMTNQTEWARRLLQEAQGPQADKAFDLGSVAGEALHRVIRLARNPVEVL